MTNLEVRMTSELCGGSVSLVSTEPRSEKVSAMLSPSTLARLDAYRASRRWSRSAAIEALIEEGLQRDEGQGGGK